MHCGVLKSSLGTALHLWMEKRESKCIVVLVIYCTENVLCIVNDLGNLFSAVVAENQLMQ